MSDYEIPTLEDTEFYRGLWYGPQGKGKTTAIATVAHAADEVGGKVIYIDADDGLKAEALRRVGIPTAPFEPYRDVSYEGLLKLHDIIGNRLADGHNIYALCWDTTTKTASVQLEKITDDAYKANMAKPQAKRTPRTETDVWQDDYGVLAHQMRKLVRRFHALDMHLLIGAHERKDKDDDTGKVVIQPAMSPSVITDVLGYMDFCIHCRTEDFDDAALVDGMEFSGLTRPKGRFVAKDRFGLLPRVMADPSFLRVMDYYRGTLKSADDPLQKAAIARRSAKAEADKAAEDTAKEAAKAKAEKEAD
jgi:hypothetical protein